VSFLIIYGHKNTDAKLKILIIIAIAFVLLIPITTFAQPISDERITITTDKLQYTKNEEVKINIKINDNTIEKFSVYGIYDYKSEISKTMQTDENEEISFSVHDLTSNYGDSGIFEIRVTEADDFLNPILSKYIIIADDEFPEIPFNLEEPPNNQKWLISYEISPYGFDIDEDLGKIYLASGTVFSKIIITDLTLEKIKNIITIDTHIEDLKINHQTKKAYVTLIRDNLILVIDVKTDKVLKIISLENYGDLGSPRKITIDKEDNRIYFTYFYQDKESLKYIGGIGIIDGNSDSIIDNMEFEGGANRLIVDKNTKNIFTFFENTKEFVIIDPYQKKIIQKIDFENKFPVDFKFHNDRLYVLTTNIEDSSRKILVMDVNDAKIISILDVENQANSIMIDSKTGRLFVATPQSKEIKVIDIESEINLEQVALRSGPIKYMKYSENTDSLFLATQGSITKINFKSIQEINPENVNYRQTFVKDFPSYSKSPEEYVQRYQTDSNYKDWFNDNFPDKTIEGIVQYKETEIAKFPDNSKSPEHYIERYFEESEYQKWYDDQFPNETIQNMLGLSNQDMSELLVNIGIEKGKNGEEEKWLELVNLAINYFPENPSAHTSKGYAEIHLEKNENSISSFNQALEIDPNYVNATFGLGDANLNLGNIQVANQFYKSGLKEQPDDIWGLDGYGITLIELGDASGMEYIDKALEINETFDIGIRDKLWGLGILEEYEQLVSYYDTLDQKYKEDPAILNNVGYALQNLERYAEAKSFYEKALEIDPFDEYSKGNMNHLGSLIYQDNLQQIENDIEKMVELTDQAVKFDANGNTVDAKKNFEEALELLETKIAPLAPDAKSKQEIDEKINEIKAQLYEYEKDSIKIPTSSKGGGCLIATATYGSELAPQVQQLRELRDDQLLSTESGTNFMNLFNYVYYSFSPHIADYERENPVFKEIVKLAITPMITSLSILNYVDMNSEIEVLGYGVSLIILNGMMYVGLPILAVMRFRK
jgi:tetratricopeptide (TPR) repeat protein